MTLQVKYEFLPFSKVDGMEDASVEGSTVELNT